MMRDSIRQNKKKRKRSESLDISLFVTPQKLVESDSDEFDSDFSNEGFEHLPQNENNFSGRTTIKSTTLKNNFSEIKEDAEEENASFPTSDFGFGSYKMSIKKSST